MSSRTNTCPHEHRQGTSVCLHCRYQARIAARAERNRKLMRGAAAGLVLAILGAAGHAGAAAMREMRDPAPGRTAMAAVSERSAAPAAPTTPSPVRPALPPPMATPAVAAPAVVEAVQADTSRPAVAQQDAREPVIAEGHTELSEEMFAVREGSIVTVHFDTELARTRRPEKFEDVVRSTLPRVFGALADSVLATVPRGALVTGGDLLTELPERGIRLPAAGVTLALWPETRPGRDGPLVISYRATITR